MNIPTGLKIGTTLRNGGNRYFLLSSRNSIQTVLQVLSAAGPTGQRLVFSNSTFDRLWALRNWTTCRWVYDAATDRWSEPLAEAMGIQSTGGNRLLLKPEKWTR